jgi:hypothetical protein
VKDAIDNFIDAILDIRWASGMTVAQSQRVAAAMVYAARDPRASTARYLLEASALIAWRGNETREAIESYSAAKAALIREVTA